MNQTQRKYASNRVDEIRSIKVAKLNQALTVKIQESKLGPPIVNYIYPSPREIVKALIDLPSTAVLLDSEDVEAKLEEFMDNIKYYSGHKDNRSDLQRLVQPTNTVEIEAAKEVNNINTAWRNETNLLINAVSEEARRVKDSIILGDNEEVLMTIKAFENQDLPELKDGVVV